MQSEPLVSVILPTYNRADWLSKSIRSAISQTFSNWELIVWDDGSADHTKEVVQSFQDDRIQYFFDMNRGQSYALNQSIKLCRGQFIAFLDDDDEWLPEKLEIQLNVMMEDPNIEVLFTDFYNLNLETKQEGLGFQQCERALKLLDTEPLTDGVYRITRGIPESLLISNFIAFDTAVIRKSVLQKADGFNEQLRNALDFEFWWRLGLAGVQFAYTERALLRRIKPMGSLSSPGIATYQNILKALDSCYLHTELSARKYLLPNFIRPYRTAWNGLIRQYALQGMKMKALNAFWNSIRYGFSWRAVYLLVGAVAGPQWIHRTRRKI